MVNSPNGGRWALKMAGPVLAAWLAGAASGQVVIHVSADAPAGGDGLAWETAFNDLQDALDAAAPIAEGGVDVQLWVASGIYVPTARLDPKEPASATFRLMNRVGIYGGFTGTEKNFSQRNHATNPTTLSGDLISWHVVSAIGTDSSAVLDGVTIEGGLCGPGFPQDSDVGAGMIIIDASPTVSECVFRDNLAPIFGARGAAVFNRGGSPRFVRCMFEANEAEAGDGGAFASFSGSPELIACRFIGNFAAFGGGALAGSGFVVEDGLFSGNVADGGGAVYGSGSYRRCVFTENMGRQSGGAVFVAFASGGCTFAGCRFSNNSSAIDAAAILATTDITAVNCVFIGNQTQITGGAVSGGGSFTNCVFNSNGQAAALFLVSENPVITNCTFVGNTGGGIIYDSFFGSLTVRNSIFWNNRFGGIADQDAQIFLLSGQPDVSHSFIQGLTGSLGGLGNIGGEADDPLLTDPDGADDTPGTLDDDLTLSAGSPCIDAGSTPSLPLDTLDVDGNGVTDEELPMDAAGASRRFDDVETADTGEGPSPIPDMGAFEYQGPPVCSGDWNQDGTLDSRDFFEFMNAFFENKADFNADGETTFQDFFDYLAAFFAGC